MAKISEYEVERLQNIARNKAQLMALGLDQFKPAVEPKEVRRPAVSKKRKVLADDNNEPIERSAPKIARIDSGDELASGTRRSARNAGKKIDYKSEQIRSLPEPVSGRSRKSGNAGPLRSGASGKKIVKFGPIPGIEVGTWWQSREDCSNDSIHAPWVAGISGTKDGGAYSIALSGGYDDDIDLGYGFTYTGAGGRDLKGTKSQPKNLRTAPQSCDQSFENTSNAALKTSCETKKPVRVIRGFKCKSEYAPSEGYRYDGLYTVEKAWMEKGLNPKGYLVCKYAFKRLPDQPPLPVKDLEAEVTDNVADADAECDDDAEGDDEDVDGEVEEEEVTKKKV